MFRGLIGGSFGFFCSFVVFPLATKFNCPRVKRYIVDHIPMQRVQEIKDLVDIMHNTSLDIIKVKRDSLNSSDPKVLAEIMEKNDIISILSEHFFLVFDQYLITA